MNRNTSACILVTALASAALWLSCGEAPPEAPPGPATPVGQALEIKASIDTGSGFTAGKPTVLFEDTYLRTAVGTIPDYDVSLDGEQFLMVAAGDSSADSETILVLNWHEELKRLVPVD